jgi:transcriptional regulator with XRE-family HTH domain
MARVREWREARGLSQEAFAERAGLKYKHYQSIEAGRKRDFRFSTLEKLAKACGMEAWELLRLDEVPLLVQEDPPNDLRATPHPRRRKSAHKAS